MLIFLIDGFTKVTDKDAAVLKDSPGRRYICWEFSWRLC
jgi:hypothetical protein